MVVTTHTHRHTKFSAQIQNIAKTGLTIIFNI